MLAAAARRSGVRVPLKRSFATATDVAGLKVATLNNGQPTASISLIVKAGSRFESKPGVAHALKNFAFKNTSDKSSLRIVREAELFGGVLSSTLGREHLALTAEFLPGDEAYFAELLSSLATSTKFTTHELNESVTSAVHAESLAALSSPAAHAVELAHTIAFRRGLGRPLFASPHSSITAEDVKSFAATAFSQGNIAVLGTGIDGNVLTKLVEKYFTGLASSTTSSASASQYFGGETRIDAPGAPTIFIGYGTTSPAPTLAVLASLLDPTPSLKWTTGTSPLAALPEGATAQVVHLPYTDAALFGVVVQAQTVDGVKEAGKAVVQALKNVASGSVKDEEVKKAIAKAKFAAASTIESRDGLLTAFAPQLLANTGTTLDALFTSFDKVSASAFSQATSELIKSKPTYVSIGEAHSMPFADELGL
ncbi:hypothetical protein BOTBODRAFT_114630 [Botryobasidium botryosum FD-172 SS1]|uniref:Cytochrome b-c1 complex subunit 2, mitochondrial n=1 Tax=Botryobasidium botryosum (strain FD-172 SS1) TaxID=930990 RepID=A0A067MH08_BOTB1|nr:hypothetical protein BOTBODRAFT_114630 [Botryobasidium botryosum FD-172 SS1]